MKVSRNGATNGAGDSGDSRQLWPMGAVTRRTGIGEHTLRAWERRFGFPTPHRLESGHRRYPGSQVQQLLLIAKALDFGYRAGDVVPLTQHELHALLRDSGMFEPAAATKDSGELTAGVLDACRRFDREALTGILRREASVLGTAGFLRERVAPLLEQVGEGWVNGELEIRHEHFFSEVLEDELRALRAPLQVSAVGRPVLLASLPEELHSMGLQIAALGIAASGRSVHVLGPNLPGEEIVRAAECVDAVAVGLSVSVYADSGAVAAEVAAIRSQLPQGIELWLGGAGSAAIERLPGGVVAVPTLEDLEVALLRLCG
jgi:DNA-binding transcriptional MerR regulator/methylmalonyl-CoA mutase cobalamin-binding subunit